MSAEGRCRWQWAGMASHYRLAAPLTLWAALPRPLGCKLSTAAQRRQPAHCTAFIYERCHAVSGDMAACGDCGAQNAALRCTRCRSVVYCDKSCQVLAHLSGSLALYCDIRVWQRKAWKQHKQQCQPPAGPPEGAIGEASPQAAPPAAPPAATPASSRLADLVNSQYAQADLGSAITVQARRGQGLCVVASRNIEPNEVFLSEAPLLLAPITASHQGYLKSFCKAEPETQKAVLNLFSVALDNKSALADEARAAAKKHAGKQWADGYSADDLQRVLLVFSLNGHSFNPTEDGTDQTALFTFGCRINHSCDSNSEYTSDRISGRGSHVALRPIAKVHSPDQCPHDAHCPHTAQRRCCDGHTPAAPDCTLYVADCTMCVAVCTVCVADCTMCLIALWPQGELISANYLGDDALMSTLMRRYLLAEQKLFNCECIRCSMPDLTRSAPCPGCQPKEDSLDPLSSGLAYAVPTHAGRDQWQCSRCSKKWSANQMFPGIAGMSGIEIENRIEMVRRISVAGEIQ